MSRVAVIGAGSWGTAFAGVVAQNACEVRLWCHSGVTADSINETHHNPRYLVDFELPANVLATPSLEQATRGCAACIIVVPSIHLRATARELAGHLDDSCDVLVLTKGIEEGSGYTMVEVVAEELGRVAGVAGLSGPNHAEEVCRSLPSAATIASADQTSAERLRSLCSTPTFRVYVSTDVRGVELCGAVKNVIAIACGMCVGLGYGDNTLALIMTRGLAELGRVVCASGGDPMTCMGLAGMGDLVATCTSPHSRNRRFGEAFVAGTSLAEFERETHMVVEGAHAVVSVRELARAHGVEVPIADAVWQVVFGGATVEQMAEALMGRVATEEFYGMQASAEGK